MAGQQIILPRSGLVTIAHERYGTHSIEYRNGLQLRSPDVVLVTEQVPGVGEPPVTVQVGPYPAGTELVVELSKQTSSGSTVTDHGFSGDPAYFNTGARVWSSSYDGAVQWVFIWEDSALNTLPADSKTTVTLDPRGGFQVGHVGIGPGVGVA